MSKKIISFFLAVVFSFSLISCVAGDSPHNNYLDMDNYFKALVQIDIYGRSKAKADTLSQEIFSLLDEYHKLLDADFAHEGINNIKTLNDKASIEPVPVDARIIELIQLGKKLYDDTNGKINIALGSVTKLWNDAYVGSFEGEEIKPFIPDDSALQEASKHTDLSKVKIDTENNTVFFEDPQIILDVSAISKGFAASKIAVHFKDENSILLSIDGAITAIGGKGRKPFPVGIINPDLTNGTKVIENVSLKNMSTITTSDRESGHHYYVNEKRYGNIIDPATFYPSEYCASVSLIGQDASIIAGLSAALFCMPFEEGRSLLNEKYPDIQAIWIMPDGKIQKKM